MVSQKTISVVFVDSQKTLRSLAMENKYKLSFCNALSAIKMTQHAKKQENMIHNQVKNQSRTDPEITQMIDFSREGHYKLQ